MKETQTPDSLPVLSTGAHNGPREGAGFTEWVSILAGEPFTDTPMCSHPTLTRLAKVVNDRLPDSERHRIAHLIPSMIGTAHPEPGSPDDRRLSVRLAAWSARQILDLTGYFPPPPNDTYPRALAESAIEAAEAWSDDQNEENREKTRAAWRLTVAAFRGADNGYLANACRAARIAAGAVDAAVDAAYNADREADSAARIAFYVADLRDGADRLVLLLEGAIAEHSRLTGHQPTPVDESAWQQAREMVEGRG